MEAYEAGQRLFGESRPQELYAKAAALPGDISWHFIGHLQTNKLKMVLPYVSMVESVDTVHLLEAIDRWGRANGRTTDVLLEMHIASEDTKQGFSEEEISARLGEPAALAAQFDGPSAPPKAGNKPLAAFGLCFVDLLAVCLFLTLLAWSLAMGAAALGCGAVGALAALWR